MELLYLWIHQSENGFIKNKGVNFSPIHRFNMKIQNNGFYLDYNEVETINIFSNDTNKGAISNLTAIVGKNGAGKTSLLKYLYRSIMPLPIKVRYDIAYEKHDLEQIEYTMSVWVFGESAGTIHVCYYLNNEELNIDKTLNFKIYNLIDESDRLIQKPNSKYDEVGTIYNDITTVYLSNSGYHHDLDGFSSYGNLSKCVLTPLSLRVVASSFYKLIMEIENLKYPNKFKQIQYIINESKNEKDFQQICDILYFNKLYKNNMFNDYHAKISTDIIINFQSLMNILLKKYNFASFREEQLQDENLKQLHKLHVFANNSLGRYSFVNSTKSEFSLFVNLYTSLFLEVSFTYEMFNEMEKVDLFNNYNEFKQYLYDVIIEFKSRNNAQYGYFIKAFHEIRALEDLLINEPNVEDKLPLGDLARKSGIIVSYRSNKNIYIKFLSLIQKSFSSKKSFLLKYLQIGNLEMSSGERAFQNIFSWLNLLPEFHKISKSISVDSLKTNVLLLIDEVDLYLHPDWQRQLLSFLVDELNKQFIGHKIQIVCTTHSPIVLSDIPKMNTVYLDVMNKELIIDNHDKHQETSRNICG